MCEGVALVLSSHVQWLSSHTKHRRGPLPPLRKPPVLHWYYRACVVGLLSKLYIHLLYTGPGVGKLPWGVQVIN